jgi:hypothetical protein
VNEHHRLEVAIYEVEEDLLLSEMRRFVREETALSPPSLIISKIKKFARSVDKFVRREAEEDWGRWRALVVPGRTITLKQEVAEFLASNNVGSRAFV